MNVQEVGKLLSFDLKLNLNQRKIAPGKAIHFVAGWLREFCSSHKEEQDKTKRPKKRSRSGKQTSGAIHKICLFDISKIKE